MDGMALSQVVDIDIETGDSLIIVMGGGGCTVSFTLSLCLSSCLLDPGFTAEAREP